MKKVLVDTDVIINFLRGRETARAFFLSLSQETKLYCSAITVAEIYAGTLTHEETVTEELLNSLIVVDIDRDVAEKAGRYRAVIKSQKLETDDCLVAASAYSIKATLVTGNAKHYPMTDIEKRVVPVK
jgi:predicted nucleic acid-binding protein